MGIPQEIKERPYPPGYGAAGIIIIWHIWSPLLILIFISVAFSARPLGIGRHFQTLLYPLLKVPRMELLSSLLTWKLGTNLPGHGPHEWLSFWCVTSKHFWFWSNFRIITAIYSGVQNFWIFMAVWFLFCNIWFNIQDSLTGFVQLTVSCKNLVERLTWTWVGLKPTMVRNQVTSLLTRRWMPRTYM